MMVARFDDINQNLKAIRDDSSSRRVFVSVVVDDLDAREDATRSGRAGGYDWTREEIAILLDMIRARKGRR